MRSSETYYVREFANLAGVTVRTLQYYDKEGLLKPSLYTEAKHRLYRREDLLRLQQILTLKYMGFSLEEIRSLLHNPTYEVRASLQIQKEAIDQRISELQKVSAALEQTINTLSSLKPTELDWSLVSEMIRGIMAGEKFKWLNRYYTEEQQQILEQRRREMSPQEMVQSWKDWEVLLNEFRVKLAEGCDPADPTVQKLAARQNELVQSFTQGDPGIFQSLKQMYDDMEKLPEEKRPYELELQKYMNQAITIYYQQKGD